MFVQISSNAALFIVFLLHVDVFQPEWSLPVDICSQIDIFCIFLSPEGRLFRCYHLFQFALGGVDVCQLFKSFLLNVCTSCGHLYYMLFSNSNCQCTFIWVFVPQLVVFTGRLFVCRFYTDFLCNGGVFKVILGKESLVNKFINIPLFS